MGSRKFRHPYGRQENKHLIDAFSVECVRILKIIMDRIDTMQEKTKGASPGRESAALRRRQPPSARKAPLLGARLRDLRRAADLSLVQLADKSGVSVGMISQIERSLSNPSVRTLERLREALGIPLTSLLEGDEGYPAQSEAPPEFVRRAKDRPHFSVGKGGLQKELLSPHGDYDIKFMLISFPPHTKSVDILVGPGEKAGVVLDGAIDLTVSGSTERLQAGDSFQFSSELSHRVENTGAEPARLLWIMNTKPSVIHL
jgi:transcriptional regulator with XRE-family HTH domain